MNHHILLHMAELVNQKLRTPSSRVSFNGACGSLLNGTEFSRDDLTAFCDHFYLGSPVLGNIRLVANGTKKNDWYFERNVQSSATNAFDIIQIHYDVSREVMGCVLKHTHTIRNMCSVKINYQEFSEYKNSKYTRGVFRIDGPSVIQVETAIRLITSSIQYHQMHDDVVNEMNFQLDEQKRLEKKKARTMLQLWEAHQKQKEKQGKEKEKQKEKEKPIRRITTSSVLSKRRFDEVEDGQIEPITAPTTTATTTTSTADTASATETTISSISLAAAVAAATEAVTVMNSMNNKPPKKRYMLHSDFMPETVDSQEKVQEDREAYSAQAEAFLASLQHEFQNN